jgi:RND family efflux transporter MFP subunit
MKQRTYRIVVIFAALALVGCQAQAPAAKPTAPQTAQVQRGNLTATLAAAGTVAARSQVVLTFLASGQVKEIDVKVGDKVKAGQVLAKQETTDLETAVTKAQVALDSSNVQLQKTKQGPTPAEVGSAKASLASAQAAYQAALNKYNLTDAQLAVARANVDKAAATVQRAQLAYDWEAHNWLDPNPSLSAQATALSDAQSAYTLTVAAYNQQAATITNSEIQSAASQVAQAQSALDKLLATPAPEDIAIAEAAVKQNEASLQQAQLALAKASVIAPVDGTVGDIYALIGQWASTSTQALVLVDLSQVNLIITLAETDVPKAQVGQQAQILLDALQGSVFTGTVTEIDLVGTVTSGVVNYSATIAVQDPSESMRPGMNATANIILQQRQNVLLVPNRAVRTVSTRLRTATVLYEGQLIDVPVTIGLTGDTQSEVLSGLQEGDVVLTSQTTATAARGVPGVGGILGGFGR